VNKYNPHSGKIVAPFFDPFGKLPIRQNTGGIGGRGFVLARGRLRSRAFFVKYSPLDKKL
jgi:hypothetical protein